jgi:para-nitrobenzyl esterase
MIIQTTHGKINGEERNGIHIFRGIPYGGNCDGSNRFLPPPPADNWDGVRDCTKNGHIAVQFGGSISGLNEHEGYFSGGKPELFGVQDETKSENCLVLNVLTPKADDKKRPVLVYMHGGGFATGTGSLVLGSDDLVRDEDIVVVGVNHRLNIFGYLYLGALDAKYAESGMAGMLDLILALEWVRDNIEAFGGDPEKVTIMGESGGGMKVSTILAMEKAHGLFRYAIVESGSSPVGTTSPEDAAKTTAAVFEKLNITTIDELLAIPAEQLLMATLTPRMGGLGPVADSINLTYNKDKNYIAPEISRDIPLLVGASEDELAVFNPPETFDITWDTLRESLLKGTNALSGSYSQFTEQNVDEIIRVFKETGTKNDSADHLYMKIVSLSSFLGAGAYYQAEAKAKQGGAPVYQYIIKYDTPLPRAGGKKYSWHTADLPLQFRVVLYPECEAISKLMSRQWAQFVRSGNPSVPELEWPAFTAGTQQIMVLDDVSRVETNPLAEIQKVTGKLMGINA